MLVANWSSESDWTSLRYCATVRHEVGLDKVSLDEVNLDEVSMGFSSNRSAVWEGCSSSKRAEVGKGCSSSKRLRSAGAATARGPRLARAATAAKGRGQQGLQQ